jgi:hypothetical protein
VNPISPRFDADLFAATWEACDSVSEVADRLDIPYATARSRAGRLRDLGVSLRAYRCGPRGGTPVRSGPVRRGQQTPAELGIDPAELRGLVEAYRTSRPYSRPSESVAGGPDSSEM